MMSFVGKAMDINQAFGKALREIRRSKGLSQEKMVGAASRIYISSLERGRKSPTLSTIDKLSKELGIHPLSLLLLAYSYCDNFDKREIQKLLKDTPHNS